MSGSICHPMVDPPGERLDAAYAGNHSKNKTSKKQQHASILTKYFAGGNSAQGTT